MLFRREGVVWSFHFFCKFLFLLIDITDFLCLTIWHIWKYQSQRIEWKRIVAEWSTKLQRKNQRSPLNAIKNKRRISKIEINVILWNHTCQINSFLAHMYNRTIVPFKQQKTNIKMSIILHKYESRNTEYFVLYLTLLLCKKRCLVVFYLQRQGLKRWWKVTGW